MFLDWEIGMAQDTAAPGPELKQALVDPPT